MSSKPEPYVHSSSPKPTNEGDSNGNSFLQQVDQCIEQIKLQIDAGVPEDMERLRVKLARAVALRARVLQGVSGQEQTEVAAELRSIVSYSSGRPRQAVADSTEHSIGADFDMEATLKLGQSLGVKLWVTQPRCIAPLIGIKVVELACGASHTMALTQEGAVLVWGWLEEADAPLCPEQVFGDKVPAVGVSAGMYHSLILSERGKVYSWGLNDYGQLGHQPAELTATGEPTAVDTLQQTVMVRVVCGMFHSTAIAHNGQVYSWGNNGFGQLGHGFTGKTRPGSTLEDNWRPRVLTGLDSPVDDIACGLHHCVAVLVNGDVATWGWGEYGQLGHGDGENESQPRVIRQLGGHQHAVQAAAGLYHSLALLEAPEWEAPKMNALITANAASTPSPRLGHTLTLVGNTLWLFGGFVDQMMSCNQVFRLNPDTQQWSKPPLSHSPPAPRHGHTAVGYGNSVVVFGGLFKKKRTKQYFNDVALIDAEGLSWEHPSIPESWPAPTPCCNHAAALIGDVMYVFGGVTQDGELFDRLWELDLKLMQWKETTQHGQIPAPRERHTLNAVNSELVLFGGWSGRRSLQDLHVLDTETNTWSTPALLTPHGELQARAGHCAVYDAQSFALYFLGGWDCGAWVPHLEVLSLGTMEWKVVKNHTDSAPPPRHSHAVATTSAESEQPRVYVFGGFGGADGSSRLNDLRVLNIHATTVAGWGWGGYGQLGIGKTDVEYAPKQVRMPPDTQMVQIASGMFHGMSLSDKGRAYTWGLGMYGQLGHVGTGLETEPRHVANLQERSEAIMCGPYQSMSISTGCEGFNWGWTRGPMCHNKSSYKKVTALLKAADALKGCLKDRMLMGRAARLIQTQFRKLRVSASRRKAQEKASQLIAEQAHECMIRSDLDHSSGEKMSDAEFGALVFCLIKLQKRWRAYTARKLRARQLEAATPEERAAMLAAEKAAEEEARAEQAAKVKAAAEAKAKAAEEKAKAEAAVKEEARVMAARAASKEEAAAEQELKDKMAAEARAKAAQDKEARAKAAQDKKEAKAKQEAAQNKKEAKAKQDAQEKEEAKAKQEAAQNKKEAKAKQEAAQQESIRKAGEEASTEAVAAEEAGEHTPEDGSAAKAAQAVAQARVDKAARDKAAKQKQVAREAKEANEVGKAAREAKKKVREATDAGEERLGAEPPKTIKPAETHGKKLTWLERKGLACKPKIPTMSSQLFDVVQTVKVPLNPVAQKNYDAAVQIQRMERGRADRKSVLWTRAAKRIQNWWLALSKVSALEAMLVDANLLTQAGRDRFRRAQAATVKIQAFVRRRKVTKALHTRRYEQWQQQKYLTTELPSPLRARQPVTSPIVSRRPAVQNAQNGNQAGALPTRKKKLGRRRQKPVTPHLDPLVYVASTQRQFLISKQRQAPIHSPRKPKADPRAHNRDSGASTPFPNTGEEDHIHSGEDHMHSRGTSGRAQRVVAEASVADLDVLDVEQFQANQELKRAYLMFKSADTQDAVAAAKIAVAAAKDKLASLEDKVAPVIAPPTPPSPPSAKSPRRKPRPTRPGELRGKDLHLAAVYNMRQTSHIPTSALSPQAPPMQPRSPKSKFQRPKPHSSIRSSDLSCYTMAIPNSTHSSCRPKSPKTHDWSMTQRDRGSRVFAFLEDETSESLAPFLMQNVDVLQLVLSSRNSKSETPLLCALASHKFQAATELIRAGANVNDCNLSAQSPAHLATAAARADVLEMLIEARAEVDVGDLHGLCPIHEACAAGQEDSVLMLIKARCDLACKDVNGANALQFAAVNAHGSIVELILQSPQGSSLAHAVDKDQRCAMHFASAGGDVSCLDHLLEAAPLMLHSVDVDGWSCLHWAADAGKVEAIAALISMAAQFTLPPDAADDGFASLDLMRADSTGKLALHCAAAAGHPQSCRLLLQKAPSSVHSCCFINKRTALHYAAELGNAEVVAVLLDGGAVDSHEADGTTAAELATQGGHNNCVTLIEEAAKAADSQELVHPQ